MSEYTREEILKLIEENGGSEGLDLSGKNLGQIDLGREAILTELEKALISSRENTLVAPVWYSAIAGIRLRYANLRGAYLWGANLRGADLEFANLHGADLSAANLKEANLGRANLQGAYLWGANLQEADLRYANLREADLGGANLRGAYLRGANLQDAKLGGANLQDAKLGGANLREADLGRANLQGTTFSHVRLDHTEMDRASLGPAIREELARDYPGARDAYLRLKQNFDDLGDYAVSSWAYRKERRMEKLEALQEAKKAWQEHDLKKAIPRYAKVVGDQLVEWVCDYGEGIWRVAGSLIAVWVAFALIYGLIAGVWGPWQDTASGRIRYITRNPIDLLSFSLGAMTTIEPAGLGARPILAMRFLAPLEALLGIFFAGLLGFVAGNRIRRS